MKASFWLALVLALSVGLSIGLQATLINRTGQEIGAVRTSLLINMAAGTLAGLVLLSFGVHLVAGGTAAYQLSLSRPVLLVTLFVGLLSIITVTGFAYSLQLIGVSATLATVILGQMLVGTLADTLGWTGSQPIPLTGTRLIGLLALGLAAYLLVPRE
ncbi:MAG: hypothetical protein GX579_21100 [Chloroflexi bacterium]|nr:hypothetical protein [Chloroflexota bacterium]